ncbi:cytochrome P450 [Daldinia bambusicola]|nr:cytochrome P450 [Daldinia bambusicola]
MPSPPLTLEGWHNFAKQGLSDGPQYQIWQVVGLLIVGYATWGVCISGYRVALHPLAKVPGPRAAALTYWYMIYYEIFLGGQYFKQIQHMHREYGPIVRINPDEVHINDPDFIGEVYPTSLVRKTDKPRWVGWRSGTPHSMVATIRHDTHRMRRASVNNFFSVASISRVEPIFVDRLQRIFRRWSTLKHGEILNMLTVFQAYASDNITTYAFGDCFHFIEEPDWGAKYFSSQEKYFKLTHVFGSFPIVMSIVHNMPKWLLTMFIPDLSSMAEKQNWRVNVVRRIRQSRGPSALNSTIFEGILDSSLPEEEKTDARMAHDAQLIILAGESTTGHSLGAILFELLSHPDIYDKVRWEVLAALSDDDVVPPFAKVQNLQFFNAVIQEGLRLHPGVVSRMARISPDKDITYHDKKRGAAYLIPAGTAASMTALALHTDPDIFEEPLEFKPQRWIDDPKLTRALLAFSRGARNCIGQEFARREMSMILAAILRHYDLYRGQKGPTLELFNTTRERDIVANSEMIIPMPAGDSKGVRVRFRS